MAYNAYISVDNDILYFILLSFTCIAVNCFVFISGYYGAKFKVKTLIGFLIQAISYSLAIALLFAILNPELLSLKYIITNSLPITNDRWWFLNVYLAIFLLSPILNKGISVLNKFQFIFIIAMLIYMEMSFPFTGYNLLSGEGLSLYSLLIMYVLGGYCNKYVKRIDKVTILYFGLFLALLAAMYFLFHIGKQITAFNITRYSSIFTILGAVLFFYIFLQLRIKPPNFIYKIAPLVFGVYLIHDSLEIRSALKTHTFDIINNHNSIFSFIIIILLAIAIFVVCISIEKVRQIITKPFLEKIYPIIDKLENKYLDK